MGSFNVDNYVDVAARITIFREKYPNGSLQSEIVAFGPEVVIVKAFAYRTPDDIRPGIGHASCPLPGDTPFRLKSEVMNAETSAWGRALVAVLAADTKFGIASRDEVASAQSAPRSPAATAPAAPKPAAPKNGKPKAVAVIPPAPPEDSNKATPEQWARLLQRYGSNAAAVRAARARFGDAVARDLDITFLQAEELLEQVSA